MATMPLWLLLLLLCWVCTCVHGLPAVSIMPQQVHLSLGREPTEMRVTWSTSESTTESLVQYGIGNLTQTASGTTTQFVDGGWLHHTQNIHSVLLTDLKPGTLYYYRCGGSGIWSDVYHFRSLLPGSDWTPRFVMYGDLGLIHDVSLAFLETDVQNHVYDLILHIGDFAYDLDSFQGFIGDWFMDQIQPVAAYVPYMTCPGNHEHAYNFSHYKNRFVMPGDELSNNMFYSFNVGPVHVVSYSTEYYFFTDYGTSQALTQYAWLEKDLQEANKPENRALRPWIITMGHRPMYCSNDDWDDCTRHESIVRVGNPAIPVPGLEDLFYKYGVDLALQAHEHSYERLWPVYNRTVMSGSSEEPYANPKAPVHIITGSAGCQEFTSGFVSDPEAWSAFRSDDYGYARMTMNFTHLYLEQISVANGGSIVDDMTIIKDKHGSYQ